MIVLFCIFCNKFWSLLCSKCFSLFVFMNVLDCYEQTLFVGTFFNVCCQSGCLFVNISDCLWRWYSFWDKCFLMLIVSFFSGESELTGATNLMAYYGLEHSYSKFSGKKLKEQLSSFLPNLPGIIDTPGHQDNRFVILFLHENNYCKLKLWHLWNWLNLIRTKFY